MSLTGKDVRDGDGRWLKSYLVDDARYFCKAYVVWSSMSSRCIPDGSTQTRRPTYQGCHASVLFQDFQCFAEWYTQQIGYGVADYDLDKDILVEGNRRYSEDTCVLVPTSLNLFLTARARTKVLYPIGVSWSTTAKKYVAQMRRNGKQSCLGYFHTPELAAAAYKFAKEAEAYRWYERLLSGEFVVDPRVTERMRTWTLEKH